MMPWLRRPCVAGGVVWYRAYVCSCLFERRRSWSDCWPQLPDIGHVATPAMLNLAAGGGRNALRALQSIRPAMKQSQVARIVHF